MTTKTYFQNLGVAKRETAEYFTGPFAKAKNDGVLAAVAMSALAHAINSRG